MNDGVLVNEASDIANSEAVTGVGDTGISDPEVGDPMSDDALVEMVQKGASRFMRMYPWLAKDIFQTGCEAAIRSRMRGNSGGAMMLRITGAVKDLLAKEAPRGLVMCSVEESYYVPDTEDTGDEVRDAAEWIEDITSGTSCDTVDKAIMTLIGIGYQYQEIATKLEYSVAGVKKRLERIRAAVGGRSNRHASMVAA